MAEAKTKHEIEAEWWAAWWEADYSWAGLAKPDKYIRDGRGDSGLQDYWRVDPLKGPPRNDSSLIAAGELIHAPDGSVWHIAHVPMFWSNGASAKSDWDDNQRAHLSAVVNARMDSAQESTHKPNPSMQVAITGNDSRAQLQGTVLLAPPAHLAKDKSINIAAKQCWLPAWQADNRLFGPETDFSNALFSGETSFERSNFAGRAIFIGTIFLDSVTFRKVNFTDFALFTQANILGEADFEYSKFSKSALFLQTSFFEHGSFDNAKFLGISSFDHANFNKGVRFSNASFNGRPNFYRVETNHCYFSGAKFENGAHFDQARFLGDAKFENTVFSGEARFVGTFFEMGTVFTGSIFNQNANFNSANFSSYTIFKEVYFRKSAIFQNVNFQTAAHAGGFRSGRLDFSKAIFSGPADYDRAAFAMNPAHHSAAFKGARFEDLVSFQNCGDHWVAALDDANIKERILIDEREESIALRNFDREVLPLARDGGENPNTEEALLKELEGGCRVIKVAMGTARNEIMEQRYYRFQLLARREHSGTPRSEKMISHLYSLTADYGMSLTRPIFGLGILLLAFAYIYALLWHVSGEFSWNDALKSIEMAASRIFPFGAFEDVSKSWFANLTKRGVTTGTVLVARSMASLQSLIALLLIFLFGLAVRRRFKVGE